MENSVNTSAPEVVANDSAPATVFAFAPEDTEQSPVDAGDVPAVEQEEQAEQTVEEPKSSDGVDDQFAEKKGQKDIGKAFAAESKRLEAKYRKQLETDPIRMLGKLMIDDLRENSDLSEEDAIKTATDNFLKAVAKRENISPNIARRLYGVKGEEAAQTEQHSTPDDEAQRILADVEAATKPAGFDMEAAFSDQAFIDLLTTVPAEIAIRLYHAEHRVGTEAQDLAEKLRARQSVPKTMVPSQPVSPKTDWLSVDSAAFQAEKERRRKLR